MEYKLRNSKVIQHGVGKKKKKKLIESTVDIGKTFKFSSKPLNLWVKSVKSAKSQTEILLVVCACEGLQDFVENMECVVLLSSSCMNVR